MSDWLDKISRAFDCEDEDRDKPKAKDEILYAPAKNGKFWNKRRRMKAFEDTVKENETSN